MTKFTRYISDNYFLISYKALFYIIAKSVGLTKLWKWMNSRANGASRWTFFSKTKKRQVSNRENNCQIDHDDESDEKDEEVTIADFVEEMNLVNEQFFDL